MSQLYARVFVKILDSSLADDWQARHVFEDFLKLADQEGLVDMTRDAFARRTNVPFDIVNRAISKLESDDPASRDPDHNGRRIARLDEHRDWGWLILNWHKYESIRTQVDLREQGRERVRRFRERKSKKEFPPSPPKKEEARTETDPETPLHVTELPLHDVTRDSDNLQIPDQLLSPSFINTWEEWKKFRRTLKKVKDWNSMFSKQLKWLGKMNSSAALEVLDQSIRNGWQGLFEPKAKANGKTNSPNI